LTGGGGVLGAWLLTLVIRRVRLIRKQNASKCL
jgi:hypothetical protein